MKNEIPEAARKFAELVNAAVRWCEAGELSKVECLKQLHDLTNSHQHELFKALREEEGNPLPEVVVETVPLDCEECGEYHTGDEYEEWYGDGSPGTCPGRTGP